jgi:hypothetical protein
MCKLTVRPRSIFGDTTSINHLVGTHDLSKP